MVRKVLVYLHTSSDQHDVLQYILENIVNRMQIAPGNIKAKIYQSTANQDFFLLEEDWSSADTHQEFVDELEENGLMDQLKEVLSDNMTTEVYDG